MQTCDNLVHIRPNRTSNLLSTEKQIVSEFRDKLQNKKVAENQRLNAFVGPLGIEPNTY